MKRLQGEEFRKWVADHKGRIIIDRVTKSQNGHYCVWLKTHYDQKRNMVWHWLNPDEEYLYNCNKLDYNL